jgi:DNA-binding CsgD family transcriptional regulator
MRERLEAWLDENPDKWLVDSFAQIAADTGMSTSSVHRMLPRIIADREEIPPSRAMEMRRESGLAGFNCRMRDKDIARIREFHSKNIPLQDIAYYLQCDVRTVKKYIANSPE